MAVKILSVDDEADLEMLLTQYFRRKIRKGEYEFYFAHNGLEALTVLMKNPDINIILSDINMPEMDGLTLLSKINEMRNPAMKCIMVSAYGDMGNIRQAMNNGAFDFATKPIDLDDLSVTIEKAIEQVNYIRNSQQEHTQLESLKTDLAIAREIQQAILPHIFPPFPEETQRLDLAARMVPAKDVGGDFYDFFRIDEDRIGVVMADVSGKGIPAAIFMAVSRTILRSTGMHGDKTSECIRYANELLCKDSVDCMFVTVFYGIYHPSTGLLEYCNAGHNPPAILKADGRVETLPPSDNFVVGPMEGMDYSESSVQLAPGDAIVLYTDGVTEAINLQNEEFGEARLQQTLIEVKGETADQVLDHIYQQVNTFAGEAEQSDDITALVLKRME